MTAKSPAKRDVSQRTNKDGHHLHSLSSWQKVQRTQAAATSIPPSSREEKTQRFSHKSLGKPPVEPGELPNEEDKGFQPWGGHGHLILPTATLSCLGSCPSHAGAVLQCTLFFSLQGWSLIPFETNQKTTIWYPFKSPPWPFITVSSLDGPALLRGPASTRLATPGQFAGTRCWGRRLSASTPRPQLSEEQRYKSGGQPGTPRQRESRGMKSPLE